MSLPRHRQPRHRLPEALPADGAAQREGRGGGGRGDHPAQRGQHRAAQTWDSHGLPAAVTHSLLTPQPPVTVSSSLSSSGPGRGRDERRRHILRRALLHAGLRLPHRHRHGGVQPLEREPPQALLLNGKQVVVKQGAEDPYVPPTALLVTGCTQRSAASGQQGAAHPLIKTPVWQMGHLRLHAILLQWEELRSHLAVSQTVPTCGGQE